MRIDIISGFLGAGKTTFIRRLLDTNLKNEKVVLIENEYGEISVDSDLLSDKKIEIKELSQGCICCSLAGDFSKSLKEIVEKFNPKRIIIEPSGVGKLTDIILAVSDAGYKDNINSLVCMVDAKKAKMYDKNFGEFFVDQIKNAHTVILSRTDVAKEETIESAVEIVRKHNESCVIVTTPIKDLADEELIKAYEGFDISLFDEIEEHHHHDDDSRSMLDGLPQNIQEVFGTRIPQMKKDISRFFTNDFIRRYGNLPDSIRLYPHLPHRNRIGEGFLFDNAGGCG